MERPRAMALNGPARIIGELAQAKLLRAVYSERQLHEVMVDFWTNHFNVFAAKGANRWLITAYDRDVIRPHAMGKFRDLLEATAKSPAMLFYLDNWMSADPNASLDLERLRELRSMRNRVNPRRRLGVSGDPEDPKMEDDPAAPAAVWLHRHWDSRWTATRSTTASARCSSRSTRRTSRSRAPRPLPATSSSTA